jgi:DNA recombination protein RmuC
MDYTIFALSGAGALLGFLMAYLFCLPKVKLLEQQLLGVMLDREELEKERELLVNRYELLREENLGIQTAFSSVEMEKEIYKEQLGAMKSLQEKYTISLSEASSLQVRLEEERRQNGEKLALLKGAEEEMKLQFSKLANEIFEQRSQVHAEQNRLQLDTILKPFKEQVSAFGKKIEENYITETKERHLLKDQIIQLRSLNERLSDDANNLTKALKGENKTQGNWGELILERILESSGLREGHEYDTQGSYKDGTGKLYRPDVVVHLPDNKDIVIDSKVSLVAYEHYIKAEDEETKNSAKKQHVSSIRAHIKGLSEKRYEELVGVKSLDFILLFMPIEGAYMLALENDADFFQEAIRQNIMVVGPSTLLVTLRTIEYIWRNERQEQNAQEIAQKAADLYDKFVAFVEDMQKIGAQLNKTQESYDAAMNKLQSGRGNLRRRTEEMKKLGIKTQKKIDAALLEKSFADA